MSDKFKVEIISPEQKILSTEASEVTIPSYEGQMGILKDHIPLITFLRPGFISVQNQVESKYFVEEGTVEFSANSFLILTSSAKDLKNLQKNTQKSLEHSVAECVCSSVTFIALLATSSADISVSIRTLAAAKA